MYSESDHKGAFLSEDVHLFSCLCDSYLKVMWHHVAQASQTETNLCFQRQSSVWLQREGVNPMLTRLLANYFIDVNYFINLLVLELL